MDERKLIWEQPALPPNGRFPLLIAVGTWEENLRDGGWHRETHMEYRVADTGGGYLVYREYQASEGDEPNREGGDLDLPDMLIPPPHSQTDLCPVLWGTWTAARDAAERHFNADGWFLDEDADPFPDYNPHLDPDNQYEIERDEDDGEECGEA